MARKGKISRKEYLKRYQKRYWAGLPHSIRADKRYYTLYKQTIGFIPHDFKVLINKKRYDCGIEKKKYNIAKNKLKKAKKNKDIVNIKRHTEEKNKYSIEIRKLRTEIKILYGLQDIAITTQYKTTYGARERDTPAKRLEAKQGGIYNYQWERHELKKGVSFGSWKKEKIELSHWDKCRVDPDGFIHHWNTGWYKKLKKVRITENIYCPEGNVTKFRRYVDKCVQPELYDSNGNPKTCLTCPKHDECVYYKPIKIKIDKDTKKILRQIKKKETKWNPRSKTSIIKRGKTREIKIYIVKKNEIDELTRWYRPITHKEGNYPEYFYKYWNRIKTPDFDKEERRHLKLQLLYRKCYKDGKLDWDCIFSGTQSPTDKPSDIEGYDPIEFCMDSDTNGDSLHDSYDYGYEYEFGG